MRRQILVPVAIFGAFALVVALLLWFGREDEPAVALGTDEAETTLVRDDSVVLGEPGSSDVVFVEFLDFECEACGAAYPIIEQLREEYAGRVTFVARYFPLDGHANARPAAHAVEAAGRQGQWEAMYSKMYETQSEWGESREPMDDRFRGYAEELGLDMAQYDADVASDEVADRVQKDVDDGMDLGIQGTPSFFLDGERFEPQSVQDFSDALDEALADQSS